jgi:hypothetical protein
MTMSDFCDCCVDNETYVREHINWNIELTYTEDEIRKFTSEDWRKEARDCIAVWQASGQPLRITADRLAEAMEEVYGVLV